MNQTTNLDYRDCNGNKLLQTAYLDLDLNEICKIIKKDSSFYAVYQNRWSQKPIEITKPNRFIRIKPKSFLKNLTNFLTK